MNYCPNCGKKVNPGDKFCSNCGSKLQRKIEDNIEDEKLSNDTFTIHELSSTSDSSEGQENVPLDDSENDEEDEDLGLSYNPLREELDGVLYSLYNTLLSIFKLDYVKADDMSTKLIKVSEQLESKIDESDEIELDNYIQTLCDKNHFAKKSDIDSVNEIIKKYENKYNDTITKKLNEQLKKRLLALSRVLIGIFNLNVSEENLTAEYNSIISQLENKITTDEVKDLKNNVLPLLDENHSATIKEIEQIKKMINLFSDSYNGKVNANNNEKIKANNSSKTNTGMLRETLNYLSGQSSSAIADADKLSDLQNYLHVKRGSLESDLLKSAKTFNTEHGKLIFLVGNVGDGKSYSIGYLKQKHPDIFSDYNVHIYYDATESSDPQKTAMETLMERLDQFSDDKIENNYENWIIAINMGVLVNFIRKARENGNFNIVINYLESTGITEKTSDITNINSEYFNLVSFRNYPLFTVDEKGITSPFYDELFGKIIAKSDDNPFYEAYLNDSKNGQLELLHHNFELFMNDSVRETLKFLLIKIQIESKVIISTRSLLELIHDILVPTEIKDKKTIYDVSLPNLLFSGTEDSSIIKKINAFDPANMQGGSEEDLTTMIYNSHKNLRELAINFLGKENAKTLDWLWEDTSSEDMAFQEKVSLLLRTKYLLDRNSSVFNDDNYYQYLELLNDLKNNGKRAKEVREFYKKIQRFIYAWCGSPREGYVFTFINNEKKFGVAIPFDLDFNNVIENNFNIIFTLENSDERTPFDLVIDYDLFVLINRVNNGYLLKNSDKHKFVNVSTFIENVIKSPKANKETLIGNVKTNKYYRLTNDGMGIELRGTEQ